MKNLFSLVIILALSAVAVPADAQTKIASVDMGKVFNNYWKTKQAQSSLESRLTELRKEVKDMADGLEKTQNEYKQLLDQANDQALSDDERNKRKQAATDKAKEINNTKGALEQFQRQADAQLADQRQRMTSNLLTEIRAAVADQAKAGGFSTVLNSATVEIVVFSDSSTDITEPVLKQLNAGAPIDVVKPAGRPTTTSTNQP